MTALTAVSATTARASASTAGQEKTAAQARLFVGPWSVIQTLTYG